MIKTTTPQHYLREVSVNTGFMYEEPEVEYFDATDNIVPNIETLTVGKENIEYEEHPSDSSGVIEGSDHWLYTPEITPDKRPTEDEESPALDADRDDLTGSESELASEDSDG